MRQLRTARLLCLVLAIIPVVARADVWTASVAAVAQKIVAKVGPGTAITLTVKNVSSLSASDVVSVKAQMTSELHSRGLHLVDARQGTTDLQLTLSENSEGYLWVAEVRRGANYEAIFTKVGRPSTVAATANPMTLQKRLLWSQDEPILDIAMTGTQGAAGAIVLTPSKVALHRLQNSTWQEVDAAAITRTRALPRDVKGLIVGAGNNPFEVYLPGSRCTVSGNNPYQIACADTDDPWPIYEGQPGLNAFFSPARNFFTGAISRTGDSIAVPPFYSAAMFGNNEWLFAGTDGVIRYSSLASTSPLPVTNWGSELTSVSSRCSADAVIMTTRKGDYTQGDAVQGYQIVGHEAVSGTGAVEFSGPVLVLRGSRESAVAVSRNLETGKYEAYSLSLACN